MKIANIEILVEQGDITQTKTEAIVNAANNKFIMGGGVALAIKKKAGDAVEAQAQEKGPVKVGQAVITSAGKLPAEYIIHAATMGLDFKTNEDIIRQAAYNSLVCAHNNNVKSIAFCALGCGTGGFSYHHAAKIMSQEVFRYLNQFPQPQLEKIVFVLNSRGAYQIFNKVVFSYLNHLFEKMSQGPYLTVDAIIEYEGGFVLIKRHNPPLGWALPGGFVDYGESVEQAVVREVKEETGLDFLKIKQFKTYSNPQRDPRFHTASVVFTGIGRGHLFASSDAKEASIFDKTNLPDKIAFDHRQIIKDYFNRRG
jgi:O-acetyl-ADP-ribose deacetylase (regulator of RNase III)/ADP-ribose pyrophosphatase YjhB (NUDIX family)